MRKWDILIGGRDRDEIKERDILIEGTSMGLIRNLTLEKFSGIHKNDPN